jgi:hypothetical protein
MNERRMNSVSFKARSTVRTALCPELFAGHRWVLILLACAAITLTPVAALAEGDGADMAKAAGIGVGTAVASLIYAPLKLTYAFGGLVVGGLAWAFSGGDSSVASIIFTPSLRGDYVVTREQLLGKQEIEFFGRRPEYRSDDGWDDMPLGEEVAAATPERW